MASTVVSNWELRLSGDDPSDKHAELCGVGDDLFQQRKKKPPSGKPSSSQQRQPSQPRTRRLFPGTDPSSRPLRGRPPRVAKATPIKERHPSFSTQLDEYLAEQEDDMFPVQQQDYALPDPSAAPPPMTMPQSIIPMGTVRLPFFIAERREVLKGTYTLSCQHSTVSRALASLASGGIQPKPPPRGPGHQVRMAFLIPVDGPECDVYIPFTAEVNDSMEGIDFCIGSLVWDRIVEVRPNLAFDDASSMPKGPSPFDPVNPHGPAAAPTTGITPTPTIIGDGNHNTAHTHVGMNPNIHQLPDSSFDNGTSMLMDGTAIFPYAPPAPPPPPSNMTGWTGDGSFSQFLNAPSMDASHPMFNDLGAGTYDHYQSFGPDFVPLDDSTIRLNESLFRSFRPG